MEFRIKKASNYEFVEYRTFSTIEELLDFMKKVGHPLIIEDDFSLGMESLHHTITIYDDYIE